ncbi:MAG: hypothetical protein LBR55_04470 [Bacteroidales bacterium]|nr:hypothetical protein [Bacteroidales bacterium]
MKQVYFIEGWLSPCSLRSHRTANSSPKNCYAIFRLCPPATPQIQGSKTMKFSTKPFQTKNTARPAKP